VKAVVVLPDELFDRIIADETIRKKKGLSVRGDGNLESNTGLVYIPTRYLEDEGGLFVLRRSPSVNTSLIKAIEKSKQDVCQHFEVVRKKENSYWSNTGRYQKSKGWRR